MGQYFPDLPEALAMQYSAGVGEELRESGV
jgi:hypothetical protein